MANRIRVIVRARVIDPLLRLLRQGATPRSIAIGMASGAVIGVFPLLGTTTVICLVVALALRLNLVAMQALNWLVYPLQILLIVPFVQAGQWFADGSPVTVSLAQLRAAYAQGWLPLLAEFGELILAGTLAWSVAAIPVGLVLYALFVRVLQRVNIAMITGGRLE